ncbi:MAG: HAMP domain-containing histidine kinase [Micrococcales bacterium]|nr:HAMP domain-containing histidine kinase [Micrococcales bacterium]
MLVRVLELVAAGLFGAVVATVSMPLWRLAARDDGPQQDKVPAEPLSESAAQTAQAFGGYAVGVTPSYTVTYCSADADTLPAFEGTKLTHPYLKALVDKAWNDMETVVRHTTFTTLGPIQAAEVRATRVADRWVLITIRDLTDQVRTRDIRHDFIANIGHELRTPITAVQVISSTLVAAADDPEVVAHFAGRLGAEADRLARLTDDVVVLAKAQDSDPTRFEQVDLAEVVETALERQQTASEAKQIDLTSRIEAWPSVWGDPASLATVVENLLSNAINYSPPKSEVALRLWESVQGREAAISVTDHGIGIDPVDQERVFERFYRADKARSRRTGGTGLGLAIVRNTVAGLGGRVTLQSTPGSGSVFTVFLPIVKLKEM